MKRFTIQVGSFEVNCSILAEDGRAWIVDPGSNAGDIVKIADAASLAPEAIILTHGHFDHIGAVPALQEMWPDIPVYLHPADRAVLTHPLNSFPPDYPPVPAPQNMHDIAELSGRCGLEVMHTPGHTPGGVCLYFPADALLLTGDTLFAGSIGRTDLPGGDFDTLTRSLKSLVALPDATTVVPGHGPETTIGAEKASNPYLRF